MEYFFSGVYKETIENNKDSLIYLKLGKIMGEDYKTMTVGYNLEAKDYYNLFICGYLTRGSNAYISESNEIKMIKYITNKTNSERGIYFDVLEDNIILTIFGENGKIIDKKESDKLNYLLSSNLNFSLSNRMGAVYDNEEIIKDYLKYEEIRNVIEND